MPQDKPVDAAAEVAKSKKLLEGAEKKFPSAMAKKAGAEAPAAPKKIQVPPASAQKKSALGEVIDQMGSTAQGLKARGEMMKGSGLQPQPLATGGTWLPSAADEDRLGAGAMPASMHDGGKVKEDGLKNLQKGETVLPKDKDKAEELAMKHLGKKAGAMGEAIEEEKEEKAEKETPAEEKKEGKKGEKKEEKAEPKKEEKAEKKEGKHGVTVIHHHKHGHTMHHMSEDGGHQMHQFELGDHSGMASKMAELTGGEGQDMGGEPQGGPPEGAPQQ